MCRDSKRIVKESWAFDHFTSYWEKGDKNKISYNLNL